MNPVIICRLYASMTIFVLYLLSIFTLCRISFILYIKDNILDNDAQAISIFGINLQDLITTLIGGFRYDSRIVGSLTVIYIILYLIFRYFKKEIKFSIIFSTIITSIIIFLTLFQITYYQIFGDTFNLILLGLIYDDQSAMINTALNSNYNILLKVLILFTTSYICFKIYKYSYEKISSIEFGSKKLVIIFTVLLLYIIPLMITSTVTLQGGSLKWLVTLPVDKKLTIAVAGSINDLNDVYKNYKNIISDNFDNYADGQKIEELISLYFNKDIKEVDTDISKYMEKQVEYGNSSKIDHIFLIIMESLSSYHFKEKGFLELGFKKPLEFITSSDKFIEVPIFIQNGIGTIETLDMMITGLYGTYIPISDRLSQIPVFLSSTGKIFQNAGYNSQFFYFGSAAWRKIGEYAYKEGFNKTISMADMTGKKRNTWGVLDKEGFDYIYSSLKNTNKPTFNMIMTTTNHPPYDIPKDMLEAPVDKIDEYLDKYYPKENRHYQSSSHVYAVTYYSIQAVGEFIKKVEKEYPDSLFIITGDHFDRVYPSKERDIYTSTSIPCIIYGNRVKDYYLKYKAASHKDIIPSILEIVAEKGFIYHSLGESFIHKENTPINIEHFALGSQSIANGRFIYNGIDLEYFENALEKEDDKVVAEKEYARKNAGAAISWYIINKGYNIDRNK